MQLSRESRMRNKKNYIKVHTEKILQNDCPHCFSMNRLPREFQETDKVTLICEKCERPYMIRKVVTIEYEFYKIEE